MIICKGEKKYGSKLVTNCQFVGIFERTVDPRQTGTSSSNIAMISVQLLQVCACRHGIMRVSASFRRHILHTFSLACSPTLYID